MAVAHLDLGTDTQTRTRGWLRSPDFVLYFLWGMFWLLMLAVAVQDYVRSGGTRYWQPILWETTSLVMATFWVVLQRRVDRQYAVYLDRPLLWIGHHIKWLPLVILTFVPIVFGVRHGIYALLGQTYTHESWPYVLLYESIKLVMFTGLWMGLIFGFSAFARSQEQHQRLLALQKSLAEAQLAHLKAQLRPHFFFNALNTISALMHVDVPRADRLLSRLADLLRATLQWGDKEITSLREEIRMLELYAQIMQERFADRVTLTWKVDNAALAGSIPALLLQPLLENAFKHGVERSRDAVRIEIEGQREGDQLRIAIRNTGSTLASGAAEGVGLRNCRERLSVLYGDAGKLQLTQLPDAVEAAVTLPWQEHHA
ncbi:MAG TPA: histidine kinase [Steroidobacteraceae bacterium]|nr:histidine kinase [Steroidobacteraceae bacterium]